MTDTILSTIGFLLLIPALGLQIVFLLRNPKLPDPASHFFITASFCFLLAATIFRSIAMRFIALTNTYEGMIMLGETILLAVILYRILSRKKALPFIMLGGTLLALLLLAVASSPALPKDIKPPVPALQSSWLALHVSFAFIGEGMFAVSFVASIVFLSAKTEELTAATDRIMYISVLVGYFFFTLGALIFGAIWAKYAWGTYWSWDPKEVWALITWLTYTAYLHVRLIAGKKGKLAAILNIAGFLFTMFTFFGVNYLLPGLHSYA